MLDSEDEDGESDSKTTESENISSEVWDTWLNKFKSKIIYIHLELSRLIFVISCKVLV